MERLAEAFGNARGRRVAAPGGRSPPVPAFLAAEADQIDTLVAGAYRALPDFALFTAQAMLYFAVVSFAEARQRLVAGADGMAFSERGDPAVESLYAESLRRLARLTGRGGRPASPRIVGASETWVASRIASRNVAGLADPGAETSIPWTWRSSSSAAACSGSLLRPSAAPCPDCALDPRLGGCPSNAAKSVFNGFG